MISVNYLKRKTVLVQLLAILLSFNITSAESAVMNDYCNTPPFVAQSVPPLVELVVGRDHKLYYEAYNDAYDLDDDGKVETGYKHSIDYYGYFDSYKCYTYDTSSPSKFIPAAVTTTKFCDGTDGRWSGNFLNWLTMSRMDVLRKVLFGGYRSTDTGPTVSPANTTILTRVYVPQDAHSWGKEFTGRLCREPGGTTRTFARLPMTA